MGHRPRRPAGPARSGRYRSPAQRQLGVAAAVAQRLRPLAKRPRRAGRFRPPAAGPGIRVLAYGGAPSLRARPVPGDRLTAGALAATSGFRLLQDRTAPPARSLRRGPPYPAATPHLLGPPP